MQWLKVPINMLDILSYMFSLDWSVHIMPRCHIFGQRDIAFFFLLVSLEIVRVWDLDGGLWLSLNSCSSLDLSLSLLRHFFSLHWFLNSHWVVLDRLCISLLVTICRSGLLVTHSLVALRCRLVALRLRVLLGLVRRLIAARRGFRSVCANGFVINSIGINCP